MQPKLRRSGKNPPLSPSSSMTRSRAVGGGAAADESPRTNEIDDVDGAGPDDSPVSVSVSAFGFGDMSVASDAAAASGLLDGPLSYLIKSANNPPQIRITVPGTQVRSNFLFRIASIASPLNVSLNYMTSRGCGLVPRNAHSTCEKQSIVQNKLFLGLLLTICIVFSRDTLLPGKWKYLWFLHGVVILLLAKWIFQIQNVTA